jgi:alpha-D-ribose 1-methylphosphonate 5-triphosphate synthase subunit PhnH
MSGPDLVGVGAGFADPVLDSQAAFRHCLGALAAPGTIVHLGKDLAPIPPLDAAASALLFALLDRDTRLWLSPGAAAGRVPANLKFHTGCLFGATPGEADFALVAALDEMPPLEEFNAGLQEYPERSATVVLQVPEISSHGWRLTGPGIRGEARLAVPALGEGFLAQWERNRARFPRGIDLYLTCGDRLCGLPRTTRIQA